MTSYNDIKQLAEERICKIKDLLVLAPINDPFYAGSHASCEKADWFAKLWLKYGYTTGIHLRRVHYRAVVEGSVLKPDGTPDGTPYENTEKDWSYLLDAGKQARYLELVPPYAFVDRRNPPSQIFRSISYPESPRYEMEPVNWLMPYINTHLSWDVSLPHFNAYGYSYSEENQPFHLEIWIEKSTMDDIIAPLCRQYHVNLVTGVGFSSITKEIELLEQRIDVQNPCRILYISDFDPAGKKMPEAICA